ncbi:MAG: RuvA C-terminal domain-containing protein [Nanoarchaeota archaeon]
MNRFYEKSEVYFSKNSNISFFILELREKLPSVSGSKDKVFDDALSALVNLGYKKNIAQEFLEPVYKKGHMDIETIIREVLKLMSEKKHG